MKKALAFFTLIVLLFVCIININKIIASDFCKYHSYVHQDIQSSSFDVYVGIDKTWPGAIRQYSTSYKARQTQKYAATFNMKNGVVWLDATKNNGNESYVSIVGPFGVHMHCTIRDK